MVNTGSMIGKQHQIRNSPVSISYASTAPSHEYNVPANISEVNVNTAGGNVRVNLPNSARKITINKTSSDSYLVTLYVSGTQIGEIAGERSSVIVESGQITKDEPWYPFDMIVGIAGVSGDGGEIIAKNKFGKVLSSDWRGTAGTDDVTVLNSVLSYSHVKNVYIRSGNYQGNSQILIDRAVSIFGDPNYTIWDLAFDGLFGLKSFNHGYATPIDTHISIRDMVIQDLSLSKTYDAITTIPLQTSGKNLLNTELAGIKIIGANSAVTVGYNGVLYTDASYLSILRDLTCNFCNYGITLYQSNCSTIDNLIANDIVNYAVKPIDTTVYADILIQNSAIEKCNIGSPVDAVIDGSNIELRKCYFEVNGGYNAKVFKATDCVFAGVTGPALAAYYSEGNTFYGNDGVLQTVGVEVSGSYLFSTRDRFLNGVVNPIHRTLSSGSFVHVQDAYIYRSGGLSLDNVNSVDIRDCEIIQPTTSGITVSFNTRNVIIDSNYIEDVGYGTATAAWEGIFLYALHGNVSNNYIYDSRAGASKTKYFIRAGSLGLDIHVIKNTINGSVSAGGVAIIDQSAAHTARIDDNIGWPTHNIGSSTGTGSEQTIAHGLAAIPTGCRAWVTYLVNGRYVTEMVPFDATNIYPTITSSLAYTWGIGAV